MGTPWSRGRTFARRPGGPGSNLADLAIIYSFFLFSDFEEQLENVFYRFTQESVSGSVEGDGQER